MSFPTFIKTLIYPLGFDKWVYDELIKKDSNIPSFSKCQSYRGGFNKFVYDFFKEQNPSIPSYRKCMNYKGGYMKWVYDNLTEPVEFASVKVKVVDSNKKNISSAEVNLSNESNSYIGTSGKAGGCTIKKVPYGEYVVKATASKFDNYKDKKKLKVDSDNVVLNIIMKKK